MVRKLNLFLRIFYLDPKDDLLIDIAIPDIIFLSYHKEIKKDIFYHINNNYEKIKFISLSKHGLSIIKRTYA